MNILLFSDLCILKALCNSVVQPFSLSLLNVTDIHGNFRLLEPNKSADQPDPHCFNAGWRFYSRTAISSLILLTNETPVMEICPC